MNTNIRDNKVFVNDDEQIEQQKREFARIMADTKPKLGTEAQCNTAYAGAYAGACTPVPRNFRDMIEDRIQMHNRLANNLHALLRALPQDISRDASEALCELITGY